MRRWGWETTKTAVLLWYRLDRAISVSFFPQHQLLLRHQELLQVCGRVCECARARARSRSRKKARARVRAHVYARRISCDVVLCIIPTNFLVVVFGRLPNNIAAGPVVLQASTVGMWVQTQRPLRNLENVKVLQEVRMTRGMESIFQAQVLVYIFTYI